MIEFLDPKDIVVFEAPVDISKQEKTYKKPAEKIKRNYASQFTNHVRKPLVKSDFVSPPKASYPLGSGDKLKITVFGEDNLSGKYAVNEEGFIFVPLVGPINAKGQTVEYVRNVLQAKLEDGYLKDPSVSIEVSEFRPVYVMGEVRNPGSFDFVADMTVRNAVAIAGGFTYRANQKSVHILREGPNDQTKRIEDIRPDYKIDPGDILLIRERFF